MKSIIFSLVFLGSILGFAQSSANLSEMMKKQREQRDSSSKEETTIPKRPTRLSSTISYRELVNVSFQEKNYSSYEALEAGSSSEETLKALTSQLQLDAKCKDVIVMRHGKCDFTTGKCPMYISSSNCRVQSNFTRCVDGEARGLRTRRDIKACIQVPTTGNTESTSSTGGITK